jgi:DNA-directed RNA polymerase specialized sigma24 family protein
MDRAGAKQQWAASEAAFRRFLEWLDQNADSAGVRYLELRQRLVMYFERRNCLGADDLADETLNRVARRLEEVGQITDAAPAQYCYIVAKFVFLEHTRHMQARAAFEKSSTGGAAKAEGETDAERREEVLSLLEQCLEKLAGGDRELILEYYRGEERAKIERRRALAKRLGLSMNALAIRSCRLRERLARCVQARLQER